MSWGLAAATLATLTVLSGVVWFERTRPDPRTIALIAAMAALAVAGRIAFAPVAGVKPTTDIVLLAGFAFGATPGFIVGCSTALISNVVFGQGLHTPWQMLAWGGVGIFGALIARALGGRPPNAASLALLCAIAALAFTLFMDVSVWVQTAPSHSLEEYLAILAVGVPFLIAHMVGSAAFALAFGRPMLAALERAKRRASARWEP
ncbi:MAG: hypothetical protein JHD16_18405, partial [Solirubrobacteraceae bacterium]|nr:hypothetical protein [Solirubrobacteraceae bacterium]